MAATIKDIVQQHLDTVRTGIIQRMTQQGRMASGKSASSLAVSATDTGGYLEGSSSFLVMEHGRGPGKVPKDFNSIIREWIIAKGISYQDLIPKSGTPEQGLTRLSGAIVHSILSKGTKLYREHGYNDIFDTVLNEELDKIADESVGVFATEVDRIHEEGTKEET